MNFKKLLLTEKIPFFLSVLLVGISVTINHLITKYTNIPLLEYSVESQTISSGQLHEYKIINLSTDKLFRDFELEVVFDPSDSAKIESVNFEFSKPYRSFSTARITMTGESARFPIEYLNPKSEVVLRVKCSSKVARPLLVFPDDNKIESPMIFLERSFLTWLIKNEVALNMTFIALLTVLVIVYFYLILKSK